MFTLVDSHKAVNVVADAVTVALIIQSELQLTYDALGYAQGKTQNGGKGDELFKYVHPFQEDGKSVNYNSEIKGKWQFKKGAFGRIRGANEIFKVGKKDEGAAKDPLDDVDKNPCIQHADLHKTMMQGGGIEVEIVQEPDPRYVECYERQKERQKREELRELCRFNFLYGSIPHSSVEKKWKEDLWGTSMAVMKVLVYAANLAVGALQTTVGQMSLTANDEYNDSYYTTSTYKNLALAIPWITQSLQTINENIPGGINQSSDYVAGQIHEGTRYVSGLIGTPPTS
ncbi:hypothetical protein THAOC_08471, partial [Thalassiosira oceanica]